MSEAFSEPRTLHHVALGARDVDGVAAFYRDVFSLPEVARHATSDGALRSVWLELGGGAVLMIERTSEEPRSVHGVGSGPFLLAFRIRADERTLWEQRLAIAGAHVEGRTEKTSYARDPEGNRVAVSFYSLPNGP
jgi:catechol 2,3-dioxygenase-like lactoylglutathione lyase family enzyme